MDSSYQQRQIHHSTGPPRTPDSLQHELAVKQIEGFTVRGAIFYLRSLVAASVPPFSPLPYFASNQFGPTPASTASGTLS
ncbi:hypothetical protein HNQ04_001763 [Deinococcus radiopugnans ATCC 19172]|uniref:Uncharacterized protein n=1 Tax=Deinococcus radiopugnans ATCC 19172 TaxID=585398 RepID=A0ABR6NR45_9DEIO|nr:hypothetical protein [Deinococcus radiopugnans ATCC 19172]